MTRRRSWAGALWFALALLLLLPACSDDPASPDDEPTQEDDDTPIDPQDEPDGSGDGSEG